MTYEIPDALAPYLEYIPDEMLVEIITDALKEKIFRTKETPSTVSDSQQFNVNQILEQIQEMLGSSTPQQISMQVKEQVKKVSTSPIVVQSTASEGVDEDLQGLVDDFAASLFK